MKTLHIMIGPSGSGKSKYALELHLNLINEQNVSSLISTDEIRLGLCGNMEDQSRNKEVFFLAHNQIYNNLLQQYMLVETNVIFDATSYSKFSRETPIMIAKLNGAKVIAHVLKTPIEVCKERNAARERKVPENVIDRQFLKFENPALSEGIDEIIYV